MFHFNLFISYFEIILQFLIIILLKFNFQFKFPNITIYIILLILIKLIYFIYFENHTPQIPYIEIYFNKFFFFITI